MADGKVTIDTRIDNSGAISGINNLEKDVKAPLKRIAGLVAVAFSVRAIKSFLTESEKLYQTQMTNEIKLETIMRQRMGATDEQIQQVKDLASEQQQLGIIGDEVQLSGAQMIATFINQKETLDTLIPAMNNLIAQQYGYNATAESAKSIGALFGKAMQGQTSALRRVGITFTEAEEKVLKYGNETQRASMLARVITNNVGEMNQALANTPLGRQMQLSNTIGDIKENFGQAYVNIKALFLPALNALATVANRVSLAFVSLSEALANAFGIDISKNTGAIASNLESEAGSSVELAEGMDNVAGSTKKANKQAKAGVRAFDELVNLSTSSDDSSSGGTSAGGVASTSINTGSADAEKSASSTIDLIGMVQEKISQLKGLIDGLFGNSDVTTSIGSFVDSVKTGLETLVTSASSIGNSIGTNLIQGIQDYFSRNKGFISTNLTEIFGNLTSITESWTELLDAISEIFTVFESPEAISCTSHFIGIFANGVLGATTLLSKFGKDVAKLISKPIVDNKDKIRTALENTFKVLEPILSMFETAVTNTFTKINEVYDTYISPAFDMVTTALSDVLGALLDAYNEYIAPTLQQIGEEANRLYTEYVQPVVDGVIEIIGRLALMIGTFVNNVLKPIVIWLIQKLAPVISTVMKTIWGVVKGVIKGISKAIQGVIGVIKSIIEFLTDVFEGDWDGAWKSIKDILDSVILAITGIFDGLKLFLDEICSAIVLLFEDAWGGIEDAWSGAKEFFSNIWGKIKEVFGKVASWFGEKFSGAWDKIKEAFGSVKEFFSNTWKNIKDAFSKVGSWFGEKFSGAWTKIKEAFSLKPIKDFFKNIWSNIKDAFGNIPSWFKEKFSEAWQKVKDVFSKGGKIFDGIKDGIVNGLGTVINGLIDGINKVIKVPFDALNKALEKIKSISIAGLEPFKWVSTITVPQIPNLKIPALATGAVLPANKPFLATVGDQKHGTNIEAPLDTIIQAMNTALGQSNNSSGGDIVINIDGNEIFRVVQNQAQQFNKRTGMNAFSY